MQMIARGEAAPLQFSGKRLGVEHDAALSPRLRYTRFNQAVPLKVIFGFCKGTLEASGQWPRAVKNPRGFIESRSTLCPRFSHTRPSFLVCSRIKRSGGAGAEPAEPRGAGRCEGLPPCPGLARPGRPQPCSGPAAHRVSLSSSAAQRPPPRAPHRRGTLRGNCDRLSKADPRLRLYSEKKNLLAVVPRVIK